MPIIYYADSIHKKTKPVAERQAAEARIQTASGSALLIDGAAAVVWPGLTSWVATDIAVNCSAGTLKDWSISRLVGRGIIKDLNDALWFKYDAFIQRIVLTPGFYTGDSLATELETQLNANSTFDSLGATPFTVGYDVSTGIFTIAPNTGNLAFVYDFQAGTPYRHSNAGVVIGFNEDHAAAGSLTSDTIVPSLGNKFVLDSATSSSDLDFGMQNAEISMDVDSAIAIDVTVPDGATSSSDAGEDVVGWMVLYKEAF